MSSRMQYACAALGLSVLAALGGPAKDNESVPRREEGVTIEKFDLPNYDDKGVMTSRIRGDAAKMLTETDIEVYGLTMEFYKSGSTNRAVDMRVTSPRCLLNKEKKAVVSDSDVRISRDNMVVTGTGFLWDNDEQMLMIQTNSRVVLKGVRKDFNPGDEIP